MKKPLKKQVPLTPEQGNLLLRLARTTIAQHLGIPVDQTEMKTLTTSLSQDTFDQKAGTFVTLHINRQLRGCIGHIEPEETIAQGIKANAVNAAFHDPRFSPLQAEEFSAVDIEVSLLSRPEKLDYVDAQDLIARLRPGIDGVILEQSYHRATFLPQVWEQLPDPSDFLTHLCRKAGLPGDEWIKGRVKISVYQVTCFDESVDSQ